MSQSLAALPVPALAIAEPRADTVNLGQVWQALKTRWKWVVGPTLLAFALSFAFVNLVAPRYTGETKVLLESRDSFYTRPGQERDQQPLIDEQAVASQVQVVMSRDLAREAIKRLELVGNPEFDPLVNGIGPVHRLLILVGLATNPFDRPPEERVLEQYYDGLVVYPAGKSRVLSVEFRAKDPELAARGANTVAELYLGLQEGAKKDTARNASTWLGTSIEPLRGRVTEAEAKVEEFRARTGLLVGSNNATITSQQLSDLNGQLTQARSAQADAQAKAQLIRDLIKSGRTFEIPDVANNELIRRLTEQRVNLRAQLALEGRTLLPEHPRMKELNAQVADLESQIRGAAERTVRTLENDARLAGSRVETLQTAVDAQKKLAATANESEVQLRALEREARAQREQLESYLARYREAMARDVENATPPDARIVSRAVTPSVPSFPKKVPIVALVTIAVFIFAAGAIVARELLSAGEPVYAGNWMPAYAGVDKAREPMTGVASRQEPTLHGFGRDNGALAQEPGLPLGEAPPAEAAAPAGPRIPSDLERYNFVSLVGRLTRTEPTGRGRRVVVTSAETAKDAADIGSGLGRFLSQNGRAILVALDAGPNQLADRVGLTDLIAGDASFTDVIEREPGSRLHLVSVGTLDGGILEGERQGVDLALSAFDQTYEWVLCIIHDNGDGRLLSLLAPQVDTVVIASNADPASGPLVDLYEQAKGAGAPDVVVAREQAGVDALERA
jgi:succinoglycan biosynthesis transport protein ExoP